MVTGCPKGRLAAKSELSPRTGGEICYNIVSCRPAGRLVIILKGRHNAKTDCLGASSGRTMPISSPRRVSFRAYQSPLRYARGGVFLLDAVAAMTGQMEAGDVQCAGSKKSLRHMQVVAREARARVRGRARAALCRRRQHHPRRPPLRRLENRPLRHPHLQQVGEMGEDVKIRNALCLSWRLQKAVQHTI